MTQILNNIQGLVFEVATTKICGEDDKKHVIYMIQVRYVSGHDDLSPSIIERRYTHFHTLYNGLKKQHPQLIVNVHFPRKVLMGNFDNSLISARSNSFERLLETVAGNAVLRASPPFMHFLQMDELNVAQALLKNGDFTAARPHLEALFRLLNKVFTDRSPVVLLALARLFACTAIHAPHAAQKWAQLLFHRYEGVSDSDLLQLYVPLLHAFLQNTTECGGDTDAYDARLTELKQRGINAASTGNKLLDVISAVESHIFNAVLI